MAQLKDLLVSGPSRLIGKLFANEAQLTIINSQKITVQNPDTFDYNYTEIFPGTVKAADDMGGALLTMDGVKFTTAGVVAGGGTITLKGPSEGGISTIMCLQDYGGTSYLTHTGSTSAVGSSSQPVYVAANGRITAITGSIANNTTGSAATLTTARTINGTSFNGSANITTTNWGTARNISISDSDATNTGTAVSVNGSAAVTLKLPATIKASITGNVSGSSGSCTGNAATATKAGAANITTTANAVAYYTNTTGTFGSKASANGALYATSANGALTFGTLPVAQGGTGKTTAAGIYEVVRDNGGDSRWVNVSGDTMTGTLTINTNLIVGSQKSGTTLGTVATILGIYGTASGHCSVAEGGYTKASGDYSHAEGFETIASGKCSYAGGQNAIASGDYSQAGGWNSIASGNYSRAEGYWSKASGTYSHAEGYYTVASGDYSHTEGRSTVATSDYNTAIGKYNTAIRSGSGSSADPYTYNAGDYAFIIGNGTNDATANRSNALTVDWDGELIANGQSFRDATRIIEKTTSGVYPNGITCQWRYRKFSNGYVDGYGLVAGAWPNYGTVNGFYAYYFNVSLPETFVNLGATINVSWNIGSAWGIDAGVKGNRTTDMNAYALTNVSGSQTIIAMIHIKGRIAAPWTRFGTIAINSSASWSYNITTIDGVKYTVNTDADDRIVNIKTTGKSTASTAAFKLYDHSIMSGFHIPNGTYYFSCAPSGGSSTTYCIGIQMYNSSTNTYSTIYDTGNGCTFTQSSTEYVNNIYFKFKSGLNTSGKTWTPKLIKTA